MKVIVQERFGPPEVLQLVDIGPPGLPRVFRTAEFAVGYAASSSFRYSVRTSCGVR
jgi:hypothetical protein